MSLVFLDLCQRGAQVFMTCLNRGAMVTTTENLHTPFIIGEQRDFSMPTHILKATGDNELTS